MFLHLLLIAALAGLLAQPLPVRAQDEGRPAYDAFGRRPDAETGDLFLYDPFLDPNWPLPEPGAFDDGVPVEPELEPAAREDVEAAEEAPVAVPPLPPYLEPGVMDSARDDGAAAPAAAPPVERGLIGGDPDLTRALEAARRVAPARRPSPARRTAPTVDEQLLDGAIPHDGLEDPLAESLEAPLGEGDASDPLYDPDW